MPVSPSPAPLEPALPRAGFSLPPAMLGIMRALSAQRDRRWTWLALAAVAGGALARAVWVFVLHPPLDYTHSDMGGYIDRATKLAEGGALERYDAFYPPGTHILLSVPLSVLDSGRTGLWGGAVLWWALSSLTPLLMWRLAGLLLTPAAAALTALLTAAWPLHVTYTGWFLSETPALFFLVLALWLGYLAGRRDGGRALALGAVAGLAGAASVANRPQFLLNLAILGVPLLVGRSRNLSALAGLAAGSAALLGAVVAYNSAAGDKLTGLSENGGLTFFIGHCDAGTVDATDPETGANFSFSAPPAIQRNNARAFGFPDNGAWDQSFFYGRGLDCIRENGLRHLTLTSRSIVDMTATTIPWPHVEEDPLGDVAALTNVLYSVALPFLVVGVLALRRRRPSRGEIVLLAHLLCFVPLAVLVFGDSRFRAPYDVFGLALLAALAADRWLDGRSRSTTLLTVREEPPTDEHGP